MKKLSTRLRPERRALILSTCSVCLSGTALILGLVRCAATNIGLQDEVATGMSYSTSISTTISTTSTATSTTTNTTTSTTTTTSTSTTSTTTSTSATTSTTTSTGATTSTTTMPVVTEPVTEIVTEPITEVVTEPIPAPAPVNQAYISDYEHTLLCNIVANEYGSDWVSTYDKACVVATVMNRVADPNFPSTIEGVLTQPYQFSGYYCTGAYYPTVTQSCIDAVDYYFTHQSEFPYYLYFDGNHYAADGSGPYNYFR